MSTTARLGMPLLAPGQAQKELFHNEALLVADAAIQASVTAVGIDAPPTDAAPGACWVIGPAPTGDWAGRAHGLAAWTTTGWRVIAAREGMAVWDLSTRSVARFVDGAWQRSAAIAGPVGGTTVDAEARATLALVLQTLRTHGLLTP